MATSTRIVLATSSSAAATCGFQDFEQTVSQLAYTTLSSQLSLTEAVDYLSHALNLASLPTSSGHACVAWADHGRPSSLHLLVRHDICVIELVQHTMFVRSNSTRRRHSHALSILLLSSNSTRRRHSHALSILLSSNTTTFTRIVHPPLVQLTTGSALAHRHLAVTSRRHHHRVATAPCCMSATLPTLSGGTIEWTVTCLIIGVMPKHVVSHFGAHDFSGPCRLHRSRAPASSALGLYQLVSPF